MTARYQVKDLANTATQTAQAALLGTYAALGQTGNTPTPVLEGDLSSFNHDYGEDGTRTYWYHPDHLGSSSYITNIEGIVTQHLEYMPYGEPSLASSPTPKKSINTSGQSLVEEHHNSINTPYKFNGKELDVETGNYYYGARYYNPKFSFWLSVDPLADIPENISFSPYTYVWNNPIRNIDPDGRTGQDIIDITLCEDGKYEITNVQITEGDDVFRITQGNQVSSYTFCDGEYGRRLNVLNVENNDNYTLGIYHVSGQSGDGATGFTVTPGGDASTVVGSNRRLPDDSYSLSASGDGCNQAAFLWVQPLLTTGENGGYVGNRGVKVHPAPSKLTETRASQWTAGCYVVSSNYSKRNDQIYFNSQESIRTSNQLNSILGSTQQYESIGRKNRPGADFLFGIDYTLIQQTKF